MIIDYRFSEVGNEFRSDGGVRTIQTKKDIICDNHPHQLKGEANTSPVGSCYLSWVSTGRCVRNGKNIVRICFLIPLYVSIGGPATRIRYNIGVRSRVTNYQKEEGIKN